MADTNPLRDTFTVIVADELARLGMDMPVTARVIAARLDAAVRQFIDDGLLDANGQRWTTYRADQWHSYLSKAGGGWMRGPRLSEVSEGQPVVLERSEETP